MKTKKIISFLIILALSLIMPIGANAQVATNFWKVTNSTLAPVISNWQLQVPSLGTAGNPCVTVNGSGLMSTQSCGGGGSGTVNTGLTGNLSYYASNGTALSATNTNPLYVGAVAATSTATSTFGGAISIQGYTVATSTTICVYPTNCQYQVPKGGLNAEIQFNAAYAALSAQGGGALYVLNGIYNPGAQIKVATGTITIGQGYGTQINVFSAGASPAYYGFFVQDASNVTIENLHIDGANQNGLGGYGIRIKNDTTGTTVSNVKILNNDFTNIYGFAVFPDSAVAGTVMTDVLIEGNHMDCRSAQDCIGGGPGTTGQTSTTSAISIVGNAITKTTAGGTNNSCIDPTAINGLNIVGNTCYGNIRLDNSQGPNMNVNISDNIVNPVYGSTVAGQIIADDSNDPAAFPSQNIKISNNILNYSDIYINGDSSPLTKNLLISGNTILMPPAGFSVPFGNINYGIFGNNITSSQISGNVIASSSSQVSKGIFLSGSTNTTASNNTITGTATGIDLGSGSGNRTILNNYYSVTTPEANVPNTINMLSNGHLLIATTTDNGAFSVSIPTTGNAFFGGSDAQTGTFKIHYDSSNRNNNFFGQYDASNNTYYGIGSTCPTPSGVVGACGYYNGLGIAGNSNGGSNPIFGVLNSAQSGNGIGSTAFTIQDGNQVYTFNNTLDNGSGFMGLGTSTPTASFVSVAASSTKATTAYNGLVDIIAGLENTTIKLFQEIDQWGNMIVSGDAPSLSSCTGGSISSDSNQRSGAVTVGTGLTSCGVVFKHPYPAGTTVHVFLNQDTGTIVSADAQSITTAGFTVSSVSVLSGDVFSYNVIATR